MIEISRLQKTFTQPGGERVPALRGIDLTIPTGQWVTVIGTNGSGKSTLLNAVAGSFLPDEGSIRIDGIEITKKPEYRRAGHMSVDDRRRKSANGGIAWLPPRTAHWY
jgi:putative ABC transport system ATP-binding protein